MVYDWYNYSWWGLFNWGAPSCIDAGRLNEKKFPCQTDHAQKLKWGWKHVKYIEISYLRDEHSYVYIIYI